MSTSMAALSERSSRRTSVRPQPMAVLSALTLVVAVAVVGAEAAALVKSNATYGGGGACMECRIAEDLELEMLLVEDLYYATAHFSRMLTGGNGGGTPTQGSGNGGAAPCRINPGQQSNCSPPPDNNNKKSCPNQYNRGCKPQ